MKPLLWRHRFSFRGGASDQPRPYRRARKQIFDVLVICTLSPVIVILVVGVTGVAVAIAITTHEPILLVQDRVGLNGRVFQMWKFRTMTTNLPRGQVTLVDDDRITPLGRVLRQSHLDELPQIWNVLKGDMSLVGPRPEQPPLVLQYTRACPEFALRLVVLPGITGWAQVSGDYAGDHSETMIKLAFDLYYIENQTLAFDVRILVKTLLVMARRGGR
jgi:lipopolysaccharide/colanic/teichoic acid biosynthesis glycosyltransferase